jgi:hypothetical protein
MRLMGLAGFLIPLASLVGSFLAIRVGRIGAVDGLFQRASRHNRVMRIKADVRRPLQVYGFTP